MILGACALSAAACGQEQTQTDQFYTLKNKGGMEVVVTNYGGRIVSVKLADKNGVVRDVVLGFDKVEDYYLENNASDFGAAIGRYANRINQGRFTLDGVEYQLPQNNFGHCLHGGPTGWQYQRYTVEEVTGNSIRLKMVSPDGDNDFPGEVTAYVTYTLTDDNAIDIGYEATTTAPTIINMTNHSYFNLSGDPANHSICDDYLYLNASTFTPADNTCMTTGEILPVEGTPMDFTTMHRIGDMIDSDYEQLITLKVYTDEPGIQMYTGNFLDGTLTGKGGVVYNKRAAICLETQHYPDSPNKPQWPSVVLRPGQTYTSHCTYAFSVTNN